MIWKPPDDHWKLASLAHWLIRCLVGGGGDRSVDLLQIPPFPSSPTHLLKQFGAAWMLRAQTGEEEDKHTHTHMQFRIQEIPGSFFPPKKSYL